MSAPARRRVTRLFVCGLALSVLVVSTADPGIASKGSLRSRSVTGRIAERGLLQHSDARGAPEGSGEVFDSAEQYATIRTAPASAVAAAAFQTARADAAALPVVGGTWREVTNVPYQTESPKYADPAFSNFGSGNGLAGGRVQALAIDGKTIYAGAADGGVWRSTDGGKTWRPLTDRLPSTSSGALAVDPRTHDVWYGTGEASTAFENYLGSGVFVSADRGKTWRRVGGHQLDGTLISALAFDGIGHVYAATSNGVYRRAASARVSSRWSLVLRPGTPGPYGFTFANDVQVRPRTGGREVVASFGWRGGRTDYAGFYVSKSFGRRGTWSKVHTRGDLRSARIARASLAFSSDGTRLYALVESWQNYTYGASSLEGVFESRFGNVAGRWTKRAGQRKLADSGSALAAFGAAYPPGVQAWYNQFIGVDPRDRDHVYVGLEEVYESRNAGKRWKTIGPYWNFSAPCYPLCTLNTTHPDQHAVAFGGGQVWVGDDGGVYSRSVTDHREGGWKNHNATLHALQYYYAGVSAPPTGGLAYWGGMQDNGVSYLAPGAKRMVSPFGGDGGDIIVDPADPSKIVTEYTDLDMALSTDGGLSDGTTSAWAEISPSCFAFNYTPDPCDPNPRFIAPFAADPEAPNTHWVAGGQYVWESTSGWNTGCSSTACDWTAVWDTETGLPDPTSITAIAVKGSVIYAAWCGGAGACNPPGFASGIDTNARGSWDHIAPTGGDPLPNRYITAIAIDPADANHLYLTFGGYSRRWIPGGGVGHVFESSDAGATWTDITGNLPDVPAADIELVGSKLVVSLDVGVFVADAGGGAATTWSRLGTGLPNAAPNDLTVTPGGGYLVAATHGRGLWQIPAP